MEKLPLVQQRPVDLHDLHKVRSASALPVVPPLAVLIGHAMCCCRSSASLEASLLSPALITGRSFATESVYRRLFVCCWTVCSLHTMAHELEHLHTSVLTRALAHITLPASQPQLGIGYRQRGADASAQLRAIYEQYLYPFDASLGDADAPACTLLDATPLADAPCDTMAGMAGRPGRRSREVGRGAAGTSDVADAAPRVATPGTPGRKRPVSADAEAVDGSGDVDVQPDSKRSRSSEVTSEGRGG